MHVQDFDACEKVFPVPYALSEPFTFNQITWHEYLRNLGDD